MRVLVQKFGGTSVSTMERRQQVVAKITAAQNAGYSPVVVVSALGRRGEPYATDTLINLARQECPDIDRREQDLIMSCGEIVAGVIVVGALRNAGIEAAFLTGPQAGIVTTSRYGNAQILRIDPDAVFSHLNRGQVAVIAGFQGRAENGDITTLGRGGSDTSAVALGAALGAEQVEIYTDVNGIMTADPRAVASARIIPSISYEEVYQMALQGAKVIHPRAVEIAMRYNLPLWIKSTFTDETGTLISNKLNGTIELIRGMDAVGLAQADDYGVMRISACDQTHSGYTSLLLDEWSRAGIDLDFINISPNGMEITATQENLTLAAHLVENNALKISDRLEGCAKVSLIGRSLSASNGVGAFIEVLQQAQIPILQTFTGPLTISGIVEREYMAASMQSLHEVFFKLKTEVMEDMQ